MATDDDGLLYKVMMGISMVAVILLALTLLSVSICRRRNRKGEKWHLNPTRWGCYLDKMHNTPECCTKLTDTCTTFH